MNKPLGLDELYGAGSTRQARRQFLDIPPDIWASDAMRSLGNNRLINFLIDQHRKHGGKENGALLATHEQLAEAGIGKRHIARAIAQCERAGLIKCQRGRRRIANRFTLTFFPLRDGTPATNEWRSFKRTEPAGSLRSLPPLCMGKEADRSLHLLPPQGGVPSSTDSVLDGLGEATGEASKIADKGLVVLKPQGTTLRSSQAQPEDRQPEVVEDDRRAAALSAVAPTNPIHRTSRSSKAATALLKESLRARPSLAYENGLQSLHIITFARAGTPAP